jgi:transcriptional regulator with XRE-family HTH domain
MSGMGTLATPTVRLRRLGTELKRIRDELGLSLDAAEVRLGRSASSISKIENGRVALPKRDLIFILDCYGVTDQPLREMLYTLSSEGRKQGWWRHYADALSPYGMDLMSLEHDAAVFRSFETIVVPGLLQTEGYARALIETGAVLMPGDLEGDLERVIHVRMKRQEVIHRTQPLRCTFLLSESVLRLLVGGCDVMREQYQHLIELSLLPQIELHVLPFTVGAHLATTGSFLILDLVEPSLSVVFLETMTSSLWVEQPDDVGRYSLAFDHLCASALSDSESRSLIANAMAEL